MYSLSTCWNSGRHTDGRAMLREIRDLGFEFAELSHGIRLSLVPGILDAVNAGEIKITTLHNFCPLPVGVTQAAPNLYQFTSSDLREREKAVRQTLQTLDFAARVKARLVVLHLGSVEMKDYTERLLEMVAAGQRDSPKYQRLCLDAETKREARREKPLAFAVEILKRLETEAAARGLMLGIENREAVEEIPFEVDFAFCFLTSQAARFATGTTPATRRSRRTSASSSTPCTWNPWRRSWRASTFTTLSSRGTITGRRGRGQLTSRRSSRSSGPSISKCSK